MTQQAIETKTVCYNHPDRETGLRCNRCERPICTSCAVLTPTGYRCKECVRGAQKVFDTAQWYDYPLAFIIAFVLAAIGSQIAGRMGFFTLFIAPVFGVIIAEAVRWVVRKRRSRLLWQIATSAAVIGALLFPLIEGALFLLFSGSPVGLLRLIWPAVYTFLIASTVYYRLSGIQIR